MKRFSIFLAGLVAMWLAPNHVRADAAGGERLARQWCANCHVIGGGAPAASMPQGPPSFQIIAGHLDAGQMRAFLSSPHGAMPDLALSRAEIDDVIAYIQSKR